ncbi:hypothetical protein BN1221_02255 [Brenneria goodwinii]|uniref:Uncharacterized protein n=1 Tax=Brenneria goodwinii TaxID=1109412 RepID=A0A0G4JV48_9GAMM|nr:hypothetical protein BN1221_02255 [Brenneria goodwinii]
MLSNVISQLMMDVAENIRHLDEDDFKPFQLTPRYSLR